jgi:formylmethanofuran dehydrogenase subunit E
MEIGTKVVRTGASDNSGRTGLVVQVENESNRVQVKWEYEKDGSLIRRKKLPATVTTWVAIDSIKNIDCDKISIKCEVCGEHTYTLAEYLDSSDPICSESCFNKYIKTL